ncbi:hypothetical protein G6F56_012936 [Rhizopus delemar]|nr:hypothetical protein G6F56_012936 [Rhizopus delemar]
MSLRSVITATKPFQSTLKIQSSRFGTLSLFAADNSVIRNNFQIPTWLEAFLWAAPKKKTSHSKKRMRASNKGLQQKENITSCPACGSNKLLHHLCGNCYSDIKKKAKAQMA